MFTQGVRRVSVQEACGIVLAGPHEGGARFNECVVKLAEYLLPPENPMERVSVWMARRTLSNFFRGGAGFLYDRLVVPLLNQPEVTGIPANSRGVAAAKDYAAKFLALVFRIFDQGGVGGHNAAELSMQLEYEKALVLWLEWNLAWSFYHKSARHRGLIISHLQTETIPVVHNNELLRPSDPAYKEAREIYSLILGELTGEEVTLEHVVQLWMHSGIPDLMGYDSIRQFYLGPAHF